VALVAVAQTVLPLTAKAPLGKEFTLTAAVSVKFTVAQPPTEALTLIVFQPTTKLGLTGTFKVTLPPVLVTALPKGIAPKKA
jgi:hypothetical protein